MRIEPTTFAPMDDLMGCAIQHVPNADLSVATVDDDVLAVPRRHCAAVHLHLTRRISGEQGKFLGIQDDQAPVLQGRS